MLPTAYHHWDAERYPSTLDVLLLTSRDGIKWYRPLERLPFLRHGADGDPTSGMLFANPWPIIVGDEVWIYYGAIGITHRENVSDRSQTGIYRARLRLDGFISADAPYGGGEFTTPPLMIQGQRLEVNIDTSGGGWAQVEVQGATGRSLEGFSQRDCDVVRGNSTRKTVTWGGSSDCSALAGKPLCLRFVMHSTRLYAFQFRED
jgi:hypothetical protein